MDSLVIYDYAPTNQSLELSPKLPETLSSPDPLMRSEQLSSYKLRLVSHVAQWIHGATFLSSTVPFLIVGYQLLTK